MTLMKRLEFNPKSFKGKLFSILVVAALAVGISWALSSITFRKVVDSIEEISKPNERMRLTNNLSYSLSKMVQFQRKQLIDRNVDSAVNYPDVEDLMLTLDTLRNTSGDNKILLQKIDSMEMIIWKYDSLLSNYLELYAEFIDDKKLSSNYRSLAEFISVIANEADSSVVTTETKTTTTTVYPSETQVEKEENKPSFFQRLFGRKDSEDLTKSGPQPQPIPQKTVKEELNIRIDTLTIGQREKMVQEFEESVLKLDQYNRIKSIELAQSELILINHTNHYINQLSDLLQAIEVDEMNRTNANNALLFSTVNRSMKRMTYIMILFVILSSLLAIMVFSDIARSIQYRKELVKAKEEAEYLSMVKQRFLANMSHEIRTPLQSIVGFSEQVIKQKNPSKEAIMIIQRSSEHLLQIINEILDYSRIISGKYTFNRISFNMYELVHEVAETMKIQASQKGIHFQPEHSIDPNNYYLGDPFRLKQILYNILGNAIKFTNEGSVRLKINHTVNLPQTEFHFQIEDTGIGISENDLKIIFNEFEQAHSAGLTDAKGTGLGLSISKSLVELQGGSITASSVPGKGSVFSFSIPYEHSEKPENLNIAEADSGKTHFKGKVMVIDDDTFILKLCSEILGRANIEHTCFSVPTEALKHWNNDYNLVLLDIRMPEMNGFELCSILREKADKNLKIIAFSAHKLEDKREAMLKRGFNDLILKPFKEHELLSVLDVHTPVNGYSIESLENSPLMQMSNGDPDFVNDVLTSFLQETKQDIQHLQNHIEKKALKETAELMHKLAGRVGQMGAASLSVRIHSLEAEWSKSELFPEVGPEFRSILKDLDALIETVENLASV
jgi:signal transduction histidine kinase/CheY-like chemotaxis protein/HPt (histidine-containing phosphotransfer) domain-containing protein